MRGLVTIGLLVLLLGVSPSAVADHKKPHKPCDRDANLTYVSATCVRNGSDLEHFTTSSEGRLYDYKWQIVCANGGICADEAACKTEDGADGFIYDIYRRRVDDPGAEWVEFATICLSPDEERRIKRISWVDAWEAMKTLAWPPADLNIQPPGGKTLVNFKTNFFTTLTQDRVQPVRLLGHGYEIRAIPESYTWHWGDGSDPEQTDEAGESYMEHEETVVFHEYLDAHVVVKPSVDVTYRGEYREQGAVEWEPIHRTLTVAGEPQRLRIIEAVPHLIG